jgi:SPP1 gp7 family putative phage head morphogenesis protein
VAKKRNRRQSPPPAATKAPLARNTNGAAMSSTDVLAAAFAAGQSLGSAIPMPRDTFPYPYGPGVAAQPAALDPVRRDTGRPEPRIFEYDVSWNLPDAGNRHRLVPWKTLRDAADNIPLFRRCIEIRKNETVSTEWDIALTKRAVQAAQRSKPGTTRAQAEEDLREQLDPQIDRILSFWKTPDQSNGYTFAEWLGQLLEEHYVLDAIAIYPRYTFGGDLYSLELLDGSTVKPLLDHRGGRPTPPFPAYQQVLHGFPRGEFTADTNHGDNGQDIDGGYPADQLIYIRRAVRTWTPYGYSAVEQALNDGDLYMRRYQWLKSEYTEGVMPSGWIRHESGAQTSWTPQQLLEYERDFNDFYAGSTANRRRFRILPPGLEPSDSPDAAEKYKPEYDLHLIKLLASHFDVSISELGFTEAKGLGSSGYHEGQSDVQDRKARLPMLRWLSSILTDISRQHLGMPEELEFRFLGLENEDEAAADEVAGARVGEARMTINEDRDRLGLPRYDFPEADMPFIRTSRGIVFIDGASKLTPPGEVIDQVTGAPIRDEDSDGVLDAPHGPDTDTGDTTDAPAATVGDVAQDPEREAAVKAERAAFRRWAAKRSTNARPFECAVLTKADAPDFADDPRIIFAKPDQQTGGESGPKRAAPGTATWPGWGPDLEAVDYWVPRIRTALRGTLDTDTIARQWAATHPLTKAAPAQQQSDGEQPPEDSDALAWLTAAGVATALTSALAFLPALHLDGWTIGHRAARTILDGRQPHDQWRPGHSSPPPGGAPALQALTDRAGTLIRGIVGSRLRRLARILSGARRRGDTTQALATALRDTLGDPTWAQSVATTEISRASAAGAIDTYQSAGIRRIAWLTEPDTRVCPTCVGNADAGPVPIGTAFPSGDLAPPAHPSCRCSTLPA